MGQRLYLCWRSSRRLCSGICWKLYGFAAGRRGCVMPPPKSDPIWRRLNPAAQAAAERLGIDGDQTALRIAAYFSRADDQIQELEKYAKKASRGAVPPPHPAPIVPANDSAGPVWSRSMTPEQRDADDKARREAAAADSAAIAQRQIRVAARAKPKPKVKVEANTANAKPDEAPVADAAVREAPPPADKVVVDLKNPLANAKAMITRRFTKSGIPTLRRHRGVFCHWTDGAYYDVSEEGIHADLYASLAESWTRNIKGGLDQVKPESKLVDQHYKALRAAAYLRDSLEAPAWIGEQPIDMPADEMLSLKNGLLHRLSSLPTRCRSSMSRPR
jgi:hypothetical protein